MAWRSAAPWIRGAACCSTGEELIFTACGAEARLCRRHGGRMAAGTAEDAMEPGQGEGVPRRWLWILMGLDSRPPPEGISTEVWKGV